MKHLSALSMMILVACGLIAALGWSMGHLAEAVGSAAAVRYVAVTGSDAANSCTDPAAPCRTIQHAVDRSDAGDEVRVAAGDYTGVGAREGVTQTVYISKTITVRGGYTLTNWLAAKPETQPTVVDAKGAGRAFYITGGGDVRLEGLEITGGEASGQGGVGIYDCGGGVFARQVDITITGCRIYGNTASTTSWLACGGGVYIGEQSRATVSGSELSDNTANTFGTTGNGGGLCSLGAEAVTLRGNLFRDNTGCLQGNGDGGGAYLANCYGAVVERNIFEGNRANTYGVNAQGGGLALSNSDQARVEDNLITGNTAGYGWAWGGGVFVEISDGVLLSRNRIISNTTSTVYPIDTFGGGVAMVDADSATLVNNVVRGNRADTGSGSGIWLRKLRERAIEVRLLHNTVADNVGSAGVAADPGDLSVELVNNIIAGHSTGVVAGAGATVDLKSTLWYANAADWTGAGTVTHAGDRSGDPHFAADGYHLTAASSAINSGEDAGVAVDIDGLSRPYGSGYDLGADEYGQRWVQLPLALRGGD